MSVTSWLRNVGSHCGFATMNRKWRRAARCKAPKRSRLQLETLEERCVPAFLAPVYYGDGSYASAVVTADFNGDGTLDLATATELVTPTQPGTNVGIFLGNGNGTFQEARNYTTDMCPTTIAAGDFNSDGKLDLVLGHSDGSEYAGINLLVGNGDGSFLWTGTWWWSASYAPSDIAVGDFDADGNLDLALSSTRIVDVFLGDGQAGFEYKGRLWNWSSDAHGIVAADFNHDGKADLAWGNAGVVDVVLSNGDGTFQPAQSYAAADPWSVSLADLNGDGNIDLVTSPILPWSGVTLNGPTNVLLGNGDGTFQAAQNYAGAGLVGDFNGDGSLDLLLGTSLLPGNGNDAGTFPAGGGPQTVGDFNGDGRWDFANTYWVQLNDGIWDGPPSPLPPSLRINDVTVAEANTGTASATFTVTLSAASTETITVAYATGNGTANADNDYQAASGTLTFGPGETSKTITVQVNGDRVGEANETFFVVLSNPTNAMIADGSGQGTIIDDEPHVSINDVSRYEGKNGHTSLFTFTVTLSMAYDVPVSLSYATADGTATTSDNDYVASSGTITFAPGETTKTITVVVKGDRKKESNENFFVDLTDLSGYAVFLDSRGTGTILNDD
jgi:Calx-beta domain/FG-GAP-like repeat